MIPTPEDGDSAEPVTAESPEPEPSPGAPGEFADEACLPIPDRPEVQKVVAEFTGVRRRSFAAALRRGGRYLPMIREILASAGLPEELCYLPLVESHYRPNARSPAGAVGLWQFMASTARASGLRVDWWADERLDPEASTRAAARHLQELYAEFMDWELVLAAYNAGAGRVARALERSPAGGFWELASQRGLRAETRRYVPKFYAAVAIARDPEAYAMAVDRSEGPLAYATVWVDSPVGLATAAGIIGTRRKILRELNPALRRGCTPPGERSYPLRVPPDAAERLREVLAATPASERLQLVRHEVRPGDTLWDIARRHGTKARAIAELNSVRDARSLRPGQALAVPVGGGVARPKRLKPAVAGIDKGLGRPVHVVAPGDTVWAIARRYSVTSREVLRWNRLARDALIKPGDHLIVGPESGESFASAGDVRVHVVRRGDTLWAISRRYGVPVGALLQRNGLAPDAVLRPGDRLWVGARDEDPS
jgi:membrane-bound lytic murein transglycosylase D